jgi:gamma-butyrobetaine dioxygenase
MPATSVLDQLDDLFAKQGAAIYLGESVTTAEHMLQSAVFAEREGAGPALVAAALLHDVGHFVNDLPVADHDYTDRRHQDSGARFLATCFPPEVTEPIRLHVIAKRYLCAIEPAYFDLLSPASIHSLGLQGGPLSTAEAESLRDNPYLADAVRLRRADDAGKVPEMATPRFSDYHALLQDLMLDTHQ